MNIFKSFSLLLAFQLCHTIIEAQQNTATTLHITDEEGLPLIGSTIKVLHSSDKSIAIVDENGQATFENLQYPVTLEVNSFGYETYITKLQAAPSNNQPINVKLNSKHLGLNEIVVTGLGKPTRLDEAVASYKIISTNEMRALGAVTLQDALRNQLGITLGQDPSLGATINVQGLSGSNIKILIDGLPLNGRENGNIDLSTINLTNIERIEIAQGPLSIMYGADALGGVINLITKNNKNSWNTEATTYLESVGRYNVNVNAAIAKKHHNVALTLGRNYFQGWDPNYDTIRNPRWRPKEQYFANLKYTYNISPDASITYASDFMNDRLFVKSSLDGFNFYNRTVQDEIVTSRRWMNRLQAKWKTGKNGYWETNNAYALYNRINDSKNIDLTTMQEDPNLRTHSSSSYHDITLRTTYNNKAGIFQYAVGYDVNFQFIDGVERIQGGKQNIGDYAAFLLTDIDIFDKKLKIQPGLRATYNSKFSAPILPSLSLLYKPSSVFKFRASYARGFRAPTLKEMYLDFKDTNHDLYGNPNLKAESGHYFQASAAYDIVQQKDYYTNISLTTGYNDITNEISLVEQGMPLAGQPTPYSYYNYGDKKILNWQIQSQTQIKNWKIALGVNLNQILKTNVNAGYNRIELNANTTYAIPSTGINISAFYKYTGKTPYLQYNDATEQIIVIDSIHYSDYHNIDISADKKFWNNRIHLTVGVKNLLNNTVSRLSTASAGSSSGNGGAHASSNSAGLLIGTGRSYFATLNFRLGK